MEFERNGFLCQRRARCAARRWLLHCPRGCAQPSGSHRGSGNRESGAALVRPRHPELHLHRSARWGGRRVEAHGTRGHASREYRVERATGRDTRGRPLLGGK